MASPPNAALCALLGTAFWTVLGYALTRLVLPRVLALGTAPVVGWAAFSAATLPILTLTGFSARMVVGIAAICLLIAAGLLLRAPAQPPPAAEPGLAPWWMAAAGALALAPAVALLPKYSAEGVHLAAPIFDHSKITIIDAMTRQGLPPVNPVFGPAGEAGQLAYYYLWHFSAAELALPLQLTLPVSGWEADVGLTWFTAFASLIVMMAAAVWLTNRASAAIVVVIVAASASLRDVLGYVSGNHELEPFLEGSTGFAGWLFQSSWAPQHLMSASCVVVAMLLLADYATRPRPACLLLLAVVVAAGFESSAFVGGVTFAVAALISAPLVFAAVETKQRLAAGIGLVMCALLAIGITAPFIRDQFVTVAGQEGSSPVVFHPFEVLGAMVPAGLRRWLDLPAYWVILLPLEFPATFITGVLALIALLQGAGNGPQKTALGLFSALAATGLAIPWLFASTLGDNNDLALRAVLPAAMILIVATVAGVLTLSGRRLRNAIAALAIGGLILSLPESVGIIVGYARGEAAPDRSVFAQTPQLWSAVRRYASPGARVANNPLFLQDLTPWPANISWALLADRSSCFAGRELAIAFAPLPPERREAINNQFIRVFAGKGSPADVHEFAATYGCDVVVVVPQDGAWTADPFAVSSDYRLAENRDGQWRIYVRSPST